MPSHAHLLRRKEEDTEVVQEPLIVVYNTFQETHAKIKTASIAEQIDIGHLVLLVCGCERYADGVGTEVVWLYLQAGLLLALLMERCLFVDFHFFNEYFAHELDFSWNRHAARLHAHGHNASLPENRPKTFASGHPTTSNLSEVADVWMFR